MTTQNYVLVWRSPGAELQPQVDCLRIDDTTFDAITAIISKVEDKPATVKMMVCSPGGVRLRPDHKVADASITTLKYGDTISVDEFWIPGTAQAWAHTKLPTGQVGWVAILYSGSSYLRTV